MSTKEKAAQASAGQYEAAMRLTHEDMAEIKPCTTYVDAQTYLEPAVFAHENKALFSNLPVPVAVSQDLPKAGSYMGVEVAGVPVILTRNREGEVQALLNTCSHRGTRLVGNGECAEGMKLSCPYHAWTYNLDGKLIGVPREDCFEAGFDKADYHLGRVPCLEAGGLIWVSLDRTRELDLERVGPELVGDFDAMGLSDMRVYKTQNYEIGANWKLVTDAFLEGYHVTRLHAKTLARFFVDAPQMIERIGQHLRQTSGSRRGFGAEHVSRDWQKLRQSVVYAYIAFPSAIVVTSPVYVSVTLLTPTARDKTHARYLMLVDKQAEPSEKMEDIYARSFDLMANAFGNEDFKAAELSQEGLRTGALKRLTLGGMEQGVRYFHDVIEELGADPAKGIEALES